MKSSIRSILKKTARDLQIKSLLASNQERGEAEIKAKLESIVPDITDQYTTFKIGKDDDYLTQKVRCQHAFQAALMLKGLKLLESEVGARAINVVDIGDSAGSHLCYLTALAADAGLKVSTLSVNLDPEAVERIRARGFRAELCRAEELHLMENGVKADLFMLFEVLEHFMDPISFLRSMATKAECRYFLVTVPYVITSRVGLHHLRRASQEKMFAENTHIFELCPEDWNLVFQFAGWRVIQFDRYTQYPKGGLLSPMRFLWRKVDYDGFYGVILEKDLSASDRYQDW